MLNPVCTHRRHLARLAAGDMTTGPLEALCTRPDHVYYVKPHDGALAVVLPVHFVSAQDAAIGHALLQARACYEGDEGARFFLGWVGLGAGSGRCTLLLTAACTVSHVEPARSI